MDFEKLISKITSHEGYRQFAYEDSLGFITIGIGRCIDRRKGKGLLMHEAMYLLRNDIDDCKFELERYPWYISLTDVRKCAMIELVFNLGIHGLLSFKKMIAAIQNNDFDAASRELLDSKWASQVGTARSNDIAYRIRYGSYQ